MTIKTFIAAAVVALTAACTEAAPEAPAVEATSTITPTEVVEVPADETEAAK